MERLQDRAGDASRQGAGLDIGLMLIRMAALPLLLIAVLLMAVVYGVAFLIRFAVLLAAGLVRPVGTGRVLDRS